MSVTVLIDATAGATQVVLGEIWREYFPGELVPGVTQGTWSGVTVPREQIRPLRAGFRRRGYSVVVV